jgi:cell division protein DivIC
LNTQNAREKDNLRVLPARQQQTAAKPRAKRHRRPTRRFFAILLALGLVYAGYVVISQEMSMAEMRKNKAELEKQIEMLKQQQGELNQAIENTKTTQFVEDTAREKLGLVKEGEVKFVEQK